MADEQTILKQIASHYLDSRDFNGSNIDTIRGKYGMDESSFREIIIHLIKNDKISLNFGDIHINPYIKAFDEESIEIQLEKLSRPPVNHICAYPSRSHLSEVVNRALYEGRPYTLRLALGEPQLAFVSFDLSILEFYRNDPRYYYETDDISGRISVRTEFYESEKMRESDKVVLESFGFSYDESLNRMVAVFLRYISRLSPQHQQIWKAKQIDGKYILQPEYARESAGYFPERLSIFTAFTEELKIINKMTESIWGKRLFRKDFSESAKPVNFSFLIRPTKKEYCDFIHTLDKMMSDNINKKFFRGKVQLNERIPIRAGEYEIRPIGTIRLLERFLQLYFRIADRTPVDDMIKTFKEIRNLRAKPAHVLDNDIFDQKYFHYQRDCVIKAYSAVRLIRLILTNHPETREIEIPGWLYEGKIFTY